MEPAPKNNIRRNPDKTGYVYRILAIILLLSAGGIIYYLFSPEEFVFFPKCPLHTLTGFECPGCGSQRAIHHLLHLRFGQAFVSNPLLVIAIPYILFCIYLEYFRGKERYPRIRRILYCKKAVFAVLIAIILFWIGRNLF